MTKQEPRVWTRAEAVNESRQSMERNQKARDAELEKYKALAATNGKEPFNLDEFAKYIDIQWRVEYSDYPQVVTREEKIEHWTYSYYVMNPDILTLKDFAVCVEELRKWDLE